MNCQPSEAVRKSGHDKASLDLILGWSLLPEPVTWNALVARLRYMDGSTMGPFSCSLIPGGSA